MSTNRFMFNSIRVYIESIRVRVSSGLIRVMSDFGSIWVIIVSDRFGFRSVQFQILGRNQFNSFSCRFGSGFGLFGSSRSVWITFAMSSKEAHGLYILDKELVATCGTYCRISS